MTWVERAMLVAIWLMQFACLAPRPPQTGAESPLTDTWSGWIEGTAADGSSWITYLDGSGRPCLHWPTRELSGAVVGEPITL